MIYGQSGTGKSTSLRNFSRDDVAIVNVSGKPLPFRNNLKTYKSDNYQAIMKAIQAAPQKSIVIDDATYLMVNEFMRTARKVLDEMDVPPVQVGKSKKYEIETLARAIVCARGMC